MRKVIVMMLTVLMALMGMGASAETVTSQNLTTEQNMDVPFSNGYTGVCIDRWWKGTDAGTVFEVRASSTADSNSEKNEESVDQYLKAALIAGHELIFNGNYNCGYNYNLLDSGSGVMLNKVFWYYTDDFGRNNVENEGLYSAQKVINAADSFVANNPDIGDSFTRELADGTTAKFEFCVMEPVVKKDLAADKNYQYFFAYKITYYREAEIEVGESHTFSAVISDDAGGNNDEAYAWTVKDGKGRIEEAFVSDAGTYKASGEDLDDHNKKIYCTVTDKNGCKSFYEFTLKVKGANDSGSGDDDSDDGNNTPTPGSAPNITLPNTNTGLVIPYDIGDTKALEIVAEGATDYQWYVDKGDGNGFTEIPNATEPSYIVPVVTRNENGYKYYCEASNENGKTDSPVFTLFIREDGSVPIITSPKDFSQISACEGENVTLAIIAVHADRYQWYVDEGDGNPKEIPGATEPSYTISGVSKDHCGNAYFCVAFNEYAGTGSPAFGLTVTACPQMPKTGDESSLGLWLTLACAGVVSALMLSRFARRKDDA